MKAISVSFLSGSGCEFHEEPGERHRGYNVQAAVDAEHHLIVAHGVGPLSEQDAESGEHRDEFSCACLQSEACHEHPACQAIKPSSHQSRRYRHRLVFTAQNRRIQHLTGVFSDANLQTIFNSPITVINNNRPDGFERDCGCGYQLL